MRNLILFCKQWQRFSTQREEGIEEVIEFEMF